MGERKLLLQASIARNYGLETVTFSVSEWCDLSSGEARRAAQENLYLQCVDAHDEYSSKHLANAPAPSEGDVDKYKTLNGRNEHEEVLCIVKTIDEEGKTRYRVKTLGMYRKYGAAIFEEVAEHYGIPALLTGDKMKYTPPKGCSVLIDASGKAPKAIKFEGLT